MEESSTEGLSTMPFRTRQSLVNVAYGGLTRAEVDLSRARVGVGWLMATRDIPEINEQHSRGASFEWVAVAFGSVSFFDLHAGVVVDSGGEVAVGVHAHRRSEAAHFLSEVCTLPYAPKYSKAVLETQINFPSHPISDLNPAELTNEFAAAVVVLCNTIAKMECR
jgi:hypothetical protein